MTVKISPRVLTQQGPNASLDEVVKVHHFAPDFHGASPQDSGALLRADSHGGSSARGGLRRAGPRDGPGRWQHFFPRERRA